MVPATQIGALRNSVRLDAISIIARYPDEYHVWQVGSRVARRAALLRTSGTLANHEKIYFDHCRHRCDQRVAAAQARQRLRPLANHVAATRAAVTSPLTVEGIARGSWYFEARFPVELRNSKGTVIAQTVAEAKGDWMTTNYVRFSATLNFSPQPAGSAGMLVLKKDNPSGLPQNGNELDIPIAF
jgi:hypothetical protein